MDNNVLDMMKKFDEKLKRAKELQSTSNPEITENAESNIQELTSEQLKLKMRIERVQDKLEEYKKEDDYLGKSESQRKIAEKEYTDRIDELRDEESKSIENLKKAKEEVEKQKSIENEEKSIKEEINKFGTAQNIRMVKDAISDVENQIDQVQLDYKTESSKISIQMEEKNMKISQVEREMDKLRKEPSWNQEKYDEYTRKIDSLKNELGLLEQMQQQNEDKRDKKIEELAGTKSKYERFSKQLEYIFYGKDILDMQKEEDEPSKTEKNQEEPSKSEEKQSATAEELTKEGKEKSATTETTKKEETEKTKAEKQFTTTESKKEETFTQENAKKAEIIISAKNDEVIVNGKPIINMGIAKAYADRKGTFKKLNINAEIRNSIGKSFILKRIFIDPIIIARIKSKMDPTIVQLIDRQENKEESTKIGEEIGLSISDYIKSIRTKEELPVDLTYDLKGSKFDNEELMSVENQMQKYARYADKITGVQVEGLKKKRNLFERLTAGFKPAGLIVESTKEEQKENSFKAGVKVDTPKSQEGKGELAKSQETKGDATKSEDEREM